jgi:hypothetical protein
MHGRPKFHRLKVISNSHFRREVDNRETSETYRDILAHLASISPLFARNRRRRTRDSARMVCGSVCNVVGRCNGSIGWIITLSVRKSKHGSIQLGAPYHFLESRREMEIQEQVPHSAVLLLTEISFCSLFSSEILTHMQPDLKV